MLVGILFNWAQDTSQFIKLFIREHVAELEISIIIKFGGLVLCSF